MSSKIALLSLFVVSVAPADASATLFPLRPGENTTVTTSMNEGTFEISCDRENSDRGEPGRQIELTNGEWIVIQDRLFVCSDRFLPQQQQPRY